MPRNDASMPGTPKVGPGAPTRPLALRAPASGTSAQSGGPGSAAGSLRLKTSMKPPSPRTQSARHRLSSLSGTTPSTPVAEASTPVPVADPGSPGPADSASDDASSDASSGPAQSRIIRRPPRFQQQQRNDRDGTKSSILDEVDEDEAEPAFLPFKADSSGAADSGGSKGSAQYTDPGATLRGDPRDFAANAARRLQNVTGLDPAPGKGKGKEKERILHQSGTSDSSNSSAAYVSKRSHSDRRQPSNPLSPRRTAELKGKGYSREGSDGTPSMGSSFSDLDGGYRSWLSRSAAVLSLPSISVRFWIVSS